MRWVAAAFAVVALSLLFVLTAPEPLATESTVASSPEPPTTFTSTTGTTESILTGPNVSRVAWVLPDDTRIFVTVEPGVADDWVGSTGAVMVDRSQAVPFRLLPSTARGVSFDDGLYQLATGSSLLQLEFSESALALLGPEPRLAIATSVSPLRQQPGPSLFLQDPFTWPERSTGATAIRSLFTTFEVRRGCDPVAAACSQAGGAQVIWSAFEFSSAPPGRQPRVTIESNVKRPSWHDTYVPPGPLPGRSLHDVLWTGEEVIVWGGVDPASGLVDGAAFDPVSSLWRRLPAAPLTPGTRTKALYVGGTMWVVSGRETVSYDVSDDSWTEIGEGRPLHHLGPAPVHDDTGLYLWSDGLARLDFASRTWTELPLPPITINSGPWRRALHYAGGLLFAISAGDPCSEREIAAWDGQQWMTLDAPPLGGDHRDCSHPRLSGVIDDRLVVWNPRSGLALLFDVANWEWESIPGVALGDEDQPLETVRMGDRLLIVDGAGRGAFLGASRARHVLPGWGEGDEMAWTGEEVVKWGLTDLGVDAWRWSP